MTHFEIIAFLAAMEPTAPSETDGTPSCFFCSAYIPKRVEDHDGDCIWRAARALLPQGL